MSKTLKEYEVGALNIKECVKKTTLNFTDIVANNNKFYTAELLDTTSGFYVFTVYGRVGSAGVKDYRKFADQFSAEKEFDKIIKSKVKKGYTEVKLVKADVGSDLGKAKVDTAAVELLKKEGVKIGEVPEIKSKLHPEVQDLVRTWFGATKEFIDLNLDTKKCPLGQLSIEQIDKAKQILQDATSIISTNKADVSELNRLTSQYYSNIPHVLPNRINANILRFDSIAKINRANDILDVFADAKNVQTVITKTSSVDAQYDTLNAELDWMDPSDPTYEWIGRMLHETRASNHRGLGKIKIHRIFSVKRNGEEINFLDNANHIAKECGKFNPSKTYASLVKSRPDVPKEYKELYKNANICPGWHGTRRANMIGIMTKGLLIRPSGVVHSGSMYGDGIYWATQASKSCQYLDIKGSFYGGNNSNNKGYLFLADVAFGNYHYANGSHFYTADKIKPKHSVFAVGGKGSGVLNDEIIVYHPTGKKQQHIIKYIVEIECNAV